VLAALPAAFRPRLFLASAAGEPVAATILVGGGERVFVPYSATAAAAAPLRAGYALRWHVMNALRGSGARWLDLGGCEGDPGLRHFKEGNVGKRGRILDIPGEFAAAGSHLSKSAAAAILGLRARADSPVLRRLYQELRRRA
jgi:lipid II:glycine glycyltransferase (peptidoglycan interpeptide bridge formation enzyme)